MDYPPQSTSWSRRPNRAGEVLYFLALFALLLVVYYPALRGGFVFDDLVYIRDNPMLQAPGALRLIWTDLGISDYWPIFYSLVLGELKMFGDGMVAYHLVNIVLHALNATLLALLLRRLKVFAPFLIGVLFALHPVCVESVAWIMQVKTLLGTAFGLAAAICYLDFDQQGGKWRYAGVWLLFTASLLTKTHLVLLPFMVLILALWRRSFPAVRRRDLVAVAGLLPSALVLGAIAVRQQLLHDSYRDMPELGSWLERLLNGAGAFWFYWGKAYFPRDLMLIYPSWHWHAEDIMGWVALFALFAAFVCALWRGGGLLAGLSTVFLALLPVLGITVISFMRYSPVADHWQYPALGGILALIVAPSARWLWEKRGKFVRIFALFTLLVLLGIEALEAARHARIFQDDASLWLATLEKNPKAWVAHYNLGSSYLRNARTIEGISHLRAAVALKPDYAHALTNLGTALSREGDDTGALQAFTSALRYDNTIVQAHAGLGAVLLHMGRMDEAAGPLERAIQLDPESISGRYSLATLLLMRHEHAAARDMFASIIVRQRGHVAAHIGLGAALVMMGDERGAEDAWREALRLDPFARDAHQDLASLLKQQGREAEAAREAELGARAHP